MTASQIPTFSFMIDFQFNLMVCSSNSIIKDAVIPFKHSTTNNLLISSFSHTQIFSIACEVVPEIFKTTRPLVYANNSIISIALITMRNFYNYEMTVY